METAIQTDTIDHNSNNFSGKVNYDISETNLPSSLPPLLILAKYQNKMDKQDKLEENRIQLKTHIYGVMKRRDEKLIEILEERDKNLVRMTVDGILKENK